jgi:hypothetical protein
MEEFPDGRWPREEKRESGEEMFWVGARGDAWALPPAS